MQPLLQFPLSILNKFGFFGREKAPKLTTLFKITCAVIIAFLEGVLVMQYLYIDSKNISEFVNNTEAVVVIIQNLSKLIYCLCYKRQFTALLKLSENFWASENCSDSAKKEIRGIVNAISYFQKVFTYSSSLVGTIFCLSIFITGKKLPLGSWSITDHDILHKCVLILEMGVLFPISCLFITAFDGLYLAFCYEIKVQFKILSEHIERIDFDQLDYEEIKVLVEHHNFLLRYVKLFRKCYSPMLMIELVTIVPMICTELYAVTESYGVIIKFRYGIGVFALAYQLALYCIPIDYLTEEMNLVSAAVYKSKWYSTKDRKSQVALRMMVYTAHREFRITACGLMEFNAETLINVYQITMSIITVLRNMGAREGG